MKQSEWTQKTLGALEQAGLIRTGFVNITAGRDGEYRLTVADPDNDLHTLTVQTKREETSNGT